MKTKQWFVILLLSCLTISVYASGSYTPRPPRIRPAEHKEPSGIDHEKYALGKKIYTGKAVLSSQPWDDKAAQERRLKDLQARLTPKEQSEANLLQYSGKLTVKQLEALEYYVANRFPSK